MVRSSAAAGRAKSEQSSRTLHRRIFFFPQTGGLIKPCRDQIGLRNGAEIVSPVARDDGNRVADEAAQALHRLGQIGVVMEYQLGGMAVTVHATVPVGAARRVNAQQPASRVEDKRLTPALFVKTRGDIFRGVGCGGGDHVRLEIVSYFQRGEMCVIPAQRE